MEANTADTPTDTQCSEVEQTENEVEVGEHGDSPTDSASGQKKAKKTCGDPLLLLLLPLPPPPPVGKYPERILHNTSSTG